MLFVKRQQIIDAHNLYVAKIIIDNIFTIDYDIKRFRNDHKLQLPHQISRTQSTKVTWLSQYLNLKLHRQTCQFTRSTSHSHTFKSEFRTVVRCLVLNNISHPRWYNCGILNLINLKRKPETVFFRCHPLQQEGQVWPMSLFCKSSSVRFGWLDVFANLLLRLQTWSCKENQKYIENVFLYLRCTQCLNIFLQTVQTWLLFDEY